MVLIANKFVIGQAIPEPPKSQDTLTPSISAGNIVIVNTPAVVPVVPVAPIIPVKQELPPRKSAYHSDMITVHKL